MLLKELATLHTAPSGTPTRETNSYLFDPVTSRRRALVLALAGCPIEAFQLADIDAFIVHLIELHENDPDAGVHSAAELALKRFGKTIRVKHEAAQTPRAGEPSSRRWYVNPEGQTLVLVDGPVSFNMGAPLADPEREDEEVRYMAKIPRRFFILSKEVRIVEFQKFAKAKLGRPHPYNKRYASDGGPQIGVSWFDAAAYCNWLSERGDYPSATRQQPPVNLRTA